MTPSIGRGESQNTQEVAPRSRVWRFLGIGLGLVVLLAVGITIWEMRTSTLQARWLAPLASELTWSLEPGPSDRIVYPGEGPYDLRFGYSRIPSMTSRATARGFNITEQVRVSDRFRESVDEWGLFPIFREKSRGGLEILDRRGEAIFAEPYPNVAYPSFDAVPPLVWQTLLFIENRSALDASTPRRNPAVEWTRLFRSVGELGLRFLGREGNVAGGSTLATQLEKFRHEPDGLTASPRQKIIQMASAALRAYQDGPETLPARQRIVLDYLNSVPLAAQRGEGEVTGLGDGLRAWYGRDFEEANRILHAADPSDPELGRVYREVLGLLISQRRPSYYLTQTAGREALATLTDQYLNILAEEGVVAEDVARVARESTTQVSDLPYPRPPASFVERKGINAVRTQLLDLLDVPRLYELDRMDLSVGTTMDAVAQRAVTDFLVSLANPDTVRARGFGEARLLDRGDPGLVVYSFVLHEITPRGNFVRVQTDNFDAPFNLNESARLELGSTAKLRTLGSYLEVIADLHASYASLTSDSLRALPLSPNDALGLWTRGQILSDPAVALGDLLRRAMARSYSANPAGSFVTGGGVQSFTNFDNTYDARSLTVTEAFRQSVNLVFIRMMRDIVNHYVYRIPGSTAHILDEPDSELRQEYLERFADREGIQFLDQFIPKFRGRTRGEILQALYQDRRLTPQRMAWVYRAAAPDPTLEEFALLLRGNQPEAEISEATIADLYRRADPIGQTLADLGYLASVHPLELWAARHLIENPASDRSALIAASAEARQEVYRWLFRTSRQGAQDTRIRSLLEVEAFTEILESWRRLGYPFENIVPSLGTAIGSSGDRPAALGELVGIILNRGVRLPTFRVEELHFAEGTPYETRMRREGADGERVMLEEVAEVLREAMIDVVQQGTARRISGGILGPDGNPLVVGGKTGTGDNRYRVFAPGGRLVESRSVNRTSTFVFFIGERHYGVVTAYVPGAEADRYWFTSALPTQILRALAPVIGEVIAEVENPAGIQG